MGLRIYKDLTVSPIVSGEPTSEPVTLTEAKSHLRVDTTDDDTLISTYISVARQWVESQVGPLMTQTWEYTIDRHWPMYGSYYCIHLPFSPVQSVTSITYVDDDGATQTLDSALYQTQLSAPIPAIWKAYNATWPSVRDQPDAITVRFVAGYEAIGSVPDPLRQAILMLVGRFYEHREEVVVGSVPYQVPFGVEALISPYALSARSW